MIKALYMAACLSMGTAAAVGEVMFMDSQRHIRQGDELGGFLIGIRADAIFPFSFYIRESVASMYMVANVLPPQITLGAVKRAIAQDPHAVKFQWFAAMQQLSIGNVDEAAQHLARMEQLGVDWTEVKNAREVFEAVKLHIEGLRKNVPADADK